MSVRREAAGDRKSTRLNSSHLTISYAVFCLKKKKTPNDDRRHAKEIVTDERSDAWLFDATRGSYHRTGRALRTTYASGGLFLFFFNDTATTEIYTLSLHDALPI